MASRTMVHASFFSRRGVGSWPSSLQLADAYPRNSFFDRDRSFLMMVDLEWVCALPTEMLHALPSSLAPLLYSEDSFAH